MTSLYAIRLGRMRFWSLWLGLLTAGCHSTPEALAADPLGPAQSPISIQYPVNANVTVDTARSRVYWRGTKLGGSHEGYFPIRRGELVLADSGGGQVWAHAGAVQIDIAGLVVTDLEGPRAERLRNHLLNEDFLAAAQHPTAAFIVRQVAPDTLGPGTWLLTGDLTLRGTTRSVRVPATLKAEGGAYHVHTRFRIDRQLWGVHYKGSADNLIADEVLLTVELYAVPKADPGKAATPDSTGAATGA